MVCTTLPRAADWLQKSGIRYRSKEKIGIVECVHMSIQEILTQSALANPLVVSRPPSRSSTSRAESPARLGELEQNRPAFQMSSNSPSQDSSVVVCMLFSFFTLAMGNLYCVFYSRSMFWNSNGSASMNLTSATNSVFHLVAATNHYPWQGELKQDRPISTCLLIQPLEKAV